VQGNNKNKRNKMSTKVTKTDLCNLLRGFVNSRPGLDYCNYGDPTSYRQEMRQITRQRADALTLLRAVELRDSITAEDMAGGFGTFFGRLSITTKDNKLALHFCEGQYYPTEYRAAVCAVLSSILWHYFRDNMPEPNYKVNGCKRLTFATMEEAKSAASKFLPAFVSIEGVYDGMSAGAYIRSRLRGEFGRGIASRWFN
jgi:hypothetical protein